MPSATINFEGINNIDGVLPPDTNGDVGPNHYVQWVNLHFQVFDRTGKSLYGPVPGNTIWSGFGGLCETHNDGDVVVRYDRMADRWMFSQFAINGVDQLGNPVPPFEQCIAVSQTPDPTGPYYRYDFSMAPNRNQCTSQNPCYFNDYPKFAVWPDAYYMSINNFALNGSFAGGGAVAFQRDKMLLGQPAVMVKFKLDPKYGGMLPSDLDGSILPPAGSPNYFGAVDTPAASTGNTFQLWKFHVDWVTPANSTFGTATHTPNTNLTTAAYTWDTCNNRPDFGRDCIAQPNGSPGLDAISDRLMNRLQYRRFPDGHESLVANHTVFVGASGIHTGVRWYEIRGLSSAPTIYQQGTYSPDSSNRWMASAAMDQAGNIAVGYSVSSSTVSPSIRYAGRLASDPLGTLPQGEATLVAGSGSQTSPSNRWGDYSMMAVDPTDDCTFWYTQEYYTTISDHGWQTRIGSFKFPGCGGPSVSGINPAAGPPSGGTTVTVSGANFSSSPGATSIKFGATQGTAVSCPTSTTCTVVSPAGTGLQHVTATVMGSTSPTSSADQFAYGTTFEDNGTLVGYSGSWGVWSNPGNSGGTAHYSSQTGATATFYFSDQYVGIVYLKDVNGGIATITIDGTVVDQLDTYASVQAFQQQRFYPTAAGSHSIGVHVSGTRNASSTGNWITFDALITGTGLPAGTVYEDNGAAVNYIGAWGLWSNSGNSGGTAHYSSQTGATATFYFSDQYVGVVYLKDVNGGIATITIDGTVVDQLDTYASVQAFQQQRFYPTAAGPHSIGVHVSGTRNASSTGNWITFDALITGSGLPAGTVYEDNGAAVNYIGAWGLWSNSGNSGGTAHYSSQTGATASFNFSGQYVGVVYLKDVNGGVAEISIDGVVVGQLDTYASARVYQQQRFYSASAGPHTINVQVSGTKNPASSGTWITLDAFIATASP